MFYQLIDDSKKIVLTEFAPSRAGVLIEFNCTNEALGNLSVRPRQQFNFDPNIVDYKKLIKQEPKLKSYRQVDVAEFIRLEEGKKS